MPIRTPVHFPAAPVVALTLLLGGSLPAGAATTNARPTPSVPAAAHVAGGSLALTPPMGFNNWNSTQCGAGFDEAMVKGIADLFVARGLKDAGYTYVNLDDCWALPQRDATGNLVPDPVRFPNGLKALADYVHDKGLKFGLYSTAGTRTCNSKGFPGGLGHERQDAALWASWGVDFLKYDNCGNQGLDAPGRYRAMSEALRATGRPILLSVCEWGQNKPWQWAPALGEMWRTTYDIDDTWSRMIGLAHQNQKLAPYAAPGAWNDPDMLEVGNGGMTDTEYRTHFSLWAQMAAPLLIGTDLRTADRATYDILLNRDVIAVDQDPLGRQGVVVSATGGKVVMAKPLADGSVAVTLTNETAATATVSTTATEIGLGNADSYVLKDLWSKSAHSTGGAIGASVPAHGTVMYRVTPAGQKAAAAGTHPLTDRVWSQAYNSHGPVETDHSNGEKPAGDGRTLSLRGTTYGRGLGTHAPAEVVYHLGGECERFSVTVGIDDESAGRGSAVFQIWRDDTKVADSGPLTGTGPAKVLTADLTGGQRLRLVTAAAGDGIDHDHTDWADPRLTC
ncbi:NPCBM/NEW2 domain-containing protein [Kitasatospora purpeofusca]|uniref:NPCBM/NEW2 domain-containing protein n=1 Tax=Kitasatospora purpeofusca TaxID=67352 RepID=UPI003F4AE999